MRKIQFIVSALLVALFLLACAPRAAPVPAPAAPAPAAAAPTQPAAAPATAPVPQATAKGIGEANWEEMLQAAKQDGRLVLYTVIGGQQRQIITDAFTSKYRVAIESMTGSTSQLLAKISAEQRAGIYSADVWTSGATAYTAVKGFIDRLEPLLVLPELTEPELMKKVWYFGEPSWVDKGRTAMLASLMDLKESITTNTDLVKPGEIKTYQDLLNPKWKGRISLIDPRNDGGGRLWFAAVLELGDVDVNYMRELVTKQELFVTADSRLQVEWLARGKHAIAIGPTTSIVTEFIQLGTPVNRFRLGTPYMSAGSSGLTILKRAPHPNAAKLFINWLLSQEGQTFFSRATGQQSQRLDVPTNHLEPSRVLGPELKVFRTDNEEVATKQNTYYAQVAKQVLGP